MSSGEYNFNTNNYYLLTRPVKVLHIKRQSVKIYHL